MSDPMKPDPTEAALALDIAVWMDESHEGGNEEDILIDAYILLHWLRRKGWAFSRREP